MLANYSVTYSATDTNGINYFYIKILHLAFLHCAGPETDHVTHGTQKENNPDMTPLLQTLVTVIILMIAIVPQTTTQIKRMAKKTMQVIENVTKRAGCNKIIRNFKDFHRTLTSMIELATNMTDRTNRKEQVQINNKTDIPQHAKTQ